MNIRIIQDRLESYQCKTVLEEEQALKEITQEVILMSLSRQNYFDHAEFHGGTALRILYSLRRFSEDLDFALLLPNHNFSLLPYLNNLSKELEAFGYEFKIQDRSTAESVVKKAFLKDDSIGKLIFLKTPGPVKKLKIKIELDTNPPSGTNTETKYLDFPAPFGVRVKDLASSFSGKLHALLCRNYIKGRDWYDFIWYVSRKTTVNFSLLKSALLQQGPWQGKKLNINKKWLVEALHKKINSIDWKQATQDVSRFIKSDELDSLGVWSTEFFLAECEKLSGYL